MGLRNPGDTHAAEINWLPSTPGMCLFPMSNDGHANNISYYIYIYLGMSPSKRRNDPGVLIVSNPCNNELATVQIAMKMSYT